MCLSIPPKYFPLKATRHRLPWVEPFRTSLHLVDDVNVGDYILIHTGFALQKISEEEALEMIRIIRDLEQETIREIP